MIIPGDAMEVLVIGGGASGMMAAISAASMGANVTIYEHNDVLGKKLSRTGNGRCNLGNTYLGLDCYHSVDADLLNEYFTQFDESDTIRTFKSLGLIIKDENGYLYPSCDQAGVVRDILITQLKAYGVKIVTSVDIESITKETPYKFAVSALGRTLNYDRVILACGSYAGLSKSERLPSDKDGYSIAYSFGHTILPVKPALTALKCKGEFFKDISGVRADAVITLLKDGAMIGSEYGQLQITDYGVSGIPIFQLSHYVGADKNASYELLIDFMPGLSEDEFIEMMQSRILSFQGAPVKDFFLGTLNTKLCTLLIDMAGLDPEEGVDTEKADDLITAISLMRALKLSVTGVKDFTHAQACSGGVPLREIDKNCMSLRSPGLYICGEMLDVDGKCGGYNLQWAWTTGYIAGKAAGTY